MTHYFCSSALDPLVLAELRRVELRSRRKVDSDLIGRYRTAFRGSGLVPSDLREYEPGDDVKHIHWKASARTGKVYVKSYEEDRQLNIVLLVDESASLNTGGEKKKSRQVVEFGALLVLLAEHTQDAIGFASFSGGLSSLLLPTRKRSQVRNIIYRLLSLDSSRKETDLAQSLRDLRARIRRQSIIFIVSDFYTPPFEEELRLLSLRHDVICVMVENSFDIDPPAGALVTFRDAESGKLLSLDTGSKRVRAYLRHTHEKRIESLKKSVQNARADMIVVNQSPLRPLLELMERRTSRRR